MLLWQQLQEAIRINHLQQVLFLLEKHHLPLDAPDPSNGFTCLFYAIQYHQSDLFQYFISHVTLDFNKNTPLMMSIAFNNSIAFHALLQNYPLMAFQSNVDGKTPMLLAVEKGHTLFVKYLIECDCDVNQSLPDGSSPLHLACAWGYFDLVTLLMQSNAQLTSNRKGFTPLDYCYSDDMRAHLLHCADALKLNKPIITPKRREPEVRGNQQATAYVSYLRTIF
jgi:ankyrin repeat protein